MFQLTYHSQVHLRVSCGIFLEINATPIHTGIGAFDGFNGKQSRFATRFEETAAV